MNRPPVVQVRAAEQPDLASVCAIVNGFIATSAVNFRTEPQEPREWERDWRRLRERYPWLVAVEDGRVVGVAYSGPWKERRAYAWTAESTVYVAPDAHGRGVGSALYGRLLELLERQRFRSVIAVLGLPNPASVRFHERHGFVRVGLLRDAGFKLDRWHDVGFWQRMLAAGAARPAPTVPVAEAST